VLITVTRLSITAVKSTRLRAVDEVRLAPGGVRMNRRFYVVDHRAHLMNGKRMGELCALLADYSEDERRLKLTFPDGRIVEGEVGLGPELSTRFFGGPAVGLLVEGPFSQALSEYAGAALRLVEAPHSAVDRGALGAASLISTASLGRLAEAGGEPGVDSRRFRMLIEVDGVPAHGEDGWVGRSTRVGQATVRWSGHVGRCLVTSRDPDSGTIDLPTLDILKSYRGGLPTTEPLPFGIHGEVLREGTVRVGDAVALIE
jgi:uncharacterized protein YcbX